MLHVSTRDGFSFPQLTPHRFPFPVSSEMAPSSTPSFPVGTGFPSTVKYQCDSLGRSLVTPASDGALGALVYTSCPAEFPSNAIHQDHRRPRYVVFLLPISPKPLTTGPQTSTGLMFKAKGSEGDEGGHDLLMCVLNSSQLRILNTDHVESLHTNNTIPAYLPSQTPDIKGQGTPFYHPSTFPPDHLEPPFWSRQYMCLIQFILQLRKPKPDRPGRLSDRTKYSVARGEFGLCLSFIPPTGPHDYMVKVRRLMCTSHPAILCRALRGSIEGEHRHPYSTTSY
jgi:hypothetical protein